MNASLPIKHTQAESELIERYEGARKGFTASVTVTVTALRDAAANQIKASGLPHRRVEEYKYSDLRAFMKLTAPLAGPASNESVKAVIEANDFYSDLERYRIVIANGTFLPELSDVAALEVEGVAVSDFNVALGAEGGSALLATPKSAGADGTLALNTAFVQGGVMISTKPGANVSKPVEIIQVASGTGAQVTRCRIEIAAGAKLRVLESFVGETGDGEINAVFDYDIGDNATLATTRLIVGEAQGPRLFSSLARLGVEAHFKAIGFVAGPSFARNQQFVAFAGENSRADLYGVTMARGTDLADQTLIVDHAVPHCNSREFFKTVLDDRAKGVYQGRINVAPHAQKSDGEMMTQALLLSEEAEMANKPELEIFADDVLCAHGATSGQIDEDLLFYLRARGIPEAEARTLLVLAFLSEAIEEFGEDDVTEVLEARVRNWLGASN